METPTNLHPEEQKGIPTPALERARERLQEVNANMTQFIRQNPARALLLALASGYLIGKWASRRR